MQFSTSSPFHLSCIAQVIQIVIKRRIMKIINYPLPLLHCHFQNDIHKKSFVIGIVILAAILMITFVINLVTNISRKDIKLGNLLRGFAQLWPWSHAHVRLPVLCKESIQNKSCQKKCRINMIKHNKGWSLECLDKYDATRGQARKANPRQSDFETG